MEIGNRYLKYHLPQLGKVNICLYPYANRTYEILEYYNHIERMKKIKHLGVIRHVFEGAHHTRWDYVMLQLYLINSLKNCTDEITGEEISKGLGLNRDIKILNKKASGFEILQMWSLLFNAGHLPGTFASERGLLKCLKADKDLKRTFLQGLPSDSKIKSNFREVLENENVYDFHKIIINFHLERYTRKYKKLVKFLHHVLEIYICNSNKYFTQIRSYRVRDKGPKQSYKLIGIYNRIRQISYLYLDSYYCPVPVYLNLPSIFTNLPEYLRMLFREKNNSIIEILDTFEGFLSTNVYHSEDSIKEVGVHSKRVENHIRENKQKKELTKITGLNRCLINNFEIFEPKHTEWGKPYTFHFILNEGTLGTLNFLEKVNKSLSYEIEEKWNRKYGVSSCNLTIQSSLANRIITINLLLKDKNKTQKNIKIIGKFLKDMVNLKMELIPKNTRRRRSSYIDWRINRFWSDAFMKFVISVLKYTTKRELDFEFKESKYWPILAIRGAKSGTDDIRKNLFDERRFRNGIEDFRKHEIKMLIEALNNIDHKSPLMISLWPILVYDEDREHLTDLDGLVLGYSRGALKILLVEAKDQGRRSRSVSKKQLEDILEKLKLKTSIEPKIKSLSKGAYCFFEIDGKV